MTKRSTEEFVRILGGREEKIVSHRRISQKGCRRQTVRNAKWAGALHGGKLPRSLRLKTLRYADSDVERCLSHKYERGRVQERYLNSGRKEWESPRGEKA